jgi:hypothetical protein
LDKQPNKDQLSETVELPPPLLLQNTLLGVKLGVGFLPVVD